MTKEEAIQKIREWDLLDEEEKEVLETLIPELKESEDEKTRKWLIRYFNELNDEIAKKDRNKIVAYLEKQGEQKYADKVEPKPAWSEEDEQYLLVCKNALAKYQTTDKWDANIISRWLENKLKSRKLQSQWEPSGEQIAALEWQVYSTYEGSWQYKASKELLEQLKKL